MGEVPAICILPTMVDLLAVIPCIVMMSAHLFPSVIAHPQCLDFLPPFEHNPLGLDNEVKLFCSDYEGFGCCSVEQDFLLKSKYKDIMSAVQNDAGIDQRVCETYLKQILCQECSPYAAHIYDAEDEGIKRPFPGLCNNYCGDFHDKCRRLISHITDDEDIAQVMQSKEQFCNKIALPDLDYCYPEWIQLNSLNQSISREARTEEGCLCLEPFAPEEDLLRNALAFRYSPDGSGRIFIAEQIGRVYVFYKNHTRVAEPFMNLEDVVRSSSNAGDERGLLNIAFHPRFAENGRLYLFYTLKDDSRRLTRVSEFLVSDEDENKMNRTSERVLLDVDQPYDNHNGGELLFGVDDYLYVFLGDGGAGGDPLGHGQKKSTLLGSVLRIDVNHYDDVNPYSIPKDNPFVNESGSRPEIYAYGIRNIWRCDVDEGDPETGYGRGRIICGDVGQNRYEEIDIILKGGNYGWNSREGFECYRRDTCDIGAEELPIYAYDHGVGKSVTGGHVYRGCLNPNLQGLYIYGDYTNGKLFSLKENRDENTGVSSWENKELQMCGTDVCFNGLVGQYQKNILSFGEDDDGEIYILSTDYPASDNFGSKIYKFVDPRRRGDPTKCRTYVHTDTDQDKDEDTDGQVGVTRITSARASTTSGAVDITWQTTTDTVLYYLIQYRLIPGGEQLGPEDGWYYINQNIPPDRRTYTVTGLSVPQVYQFRISAANAVGIGIPSLPSDIVQLTADDDETPTVPSVPSSAPLNVVVAGYSQTTIVTWWQAPPAEDWHGELSGYTVRYKVYGAQDSTTQYKSINGQHITAEIITDLEVYTEYEISVAASNSEGVGPYSPVVRARTFGGIPSAPPRDVVASADSPTSIKLSWLPPDASTVNGKIVGYKIRGRITSISQIEVEEVVPDDDTRGRKDGYLRGLREYTGYDIIVLAYTEHGDGPPSEVIQQKTAEDVPDQVGSLKFSHIQGRSLTVEWTKPNNANGIITGYTLTYQVMKIPRTRITKILAADILQYNLSNLTSDVNYTVDIYASTNAGDGPARTATVQTVSNIQGTLEICQLGGALGVRTLQCGDGQVINRTSIRAVYGRLKIGRCIRDDAGVVGCGSDVSRVIGSRCRGRKQCTLDDWFLHNRIMLQDKSSSCPSGLQQYLDISFTCMPDPCLNKPCENNGSCTAAEDPYKIGYYCYCKRNHGGRHCQIVDPCKTNKCPAKITHLCIAVMGDDVMGRVCYDKAFRIIPSDPPDN